MSVDVNAYLARIGFTGTATPDLQTLREVHRLHATTIPFENLDPLLERPVLLDMDSLHQKLVVNRRGGYCFEHNTLLAAVLETIGFQVTPLAARVRWMTPPDRPESARTHMLLLVAMDDGDYLVDVGFGGYLLDAPVKLEYDVPQRSAASAVRVIRDPEKHTIQAELPNGWQDLYRFTLERGVAADYTVANWFTSTYPEGLFRTNLLVQRIAPDCRYSLLNTRLTERRPDGVVERTVGDAAELAAILHEIFGIELPCDPSDVWSRLPVSPPRTG